MAMRASRSWGLVVPGRPPTPSEGHAQVFSRVGPTKTQKLIIFANGTCLSFGPEDLVDEFVPGAAFGEQVAMVDKAIRDCQSVTERYTPAIDGDNRAYDGFRTKPLELSRLIRISHSNGVRFLVPSKFASVGTLVPVYAGKRKNDVPGEAYPGSSVDTRFGMTEQPDQPDHQPMRRETERDSVMRVRERDEVERRRPSIQHRSRGNHQNRRGHRYGRDTMQAEMDYQPRLSLPRGARHSSGNLRQSQSIASQTPLQGYNQAFQNPSQQHYSQNTIQQQKGGQTRSQRRNLPRYPETPRELPTFASQSGNEPRLLSSRPPSPGRRFNTKPIPVDATPLVRIQHPEYQILANAKEAGSEEPYFNENSYGYRGNSEVSIRNNIISYYYAHGLDRYFESEDAYMEDYFRRQRERFHQELLRREEKQQQAWAARDQGSIDGETLDGDRSSLQGPPSSYTQPHYQTEQQGNYELARYADELNQQSLRSEAGRLRGDEFVGAQTLPIHVTSPDSYVLPARAHQRAFRHCTQNTQSTGSNSGPSSKDGRDFLNFGNYIQSSGLSESNAVSDDNSARYGSSRPPTSGSARAQAADERRAGSGGQYTSQAHRGVQINSTVLAPSGTGIFSRGPSPVASRSRFFDSRRSSPGFSRLYVGSHGSVDRSVFEGNFMRD